MRSFFLASLVPLLLLDVGACGSSAPSEPSSPGHFVADDAGEGGAAPEGGEPSVDATDLDAVSGPLCTSVPTGPTGTVTTTQGSPGFAIVGGAAWSEPALLQDDDGGQEPARGLYIALSDQVNACVVGGDSFTGVAKVNGHTLTFDLTVPGDQPPAVGTYALAFGGGNTPALSINSNVQTSCSLSTGIGADPQSTLTLTEVAADHVKGTYSVMLGSPVTGTFDVPICPPMQISQRCCLP